MRAADSSPSMSTLLIAALVSLVLGALFWLPLVVISVRWWLGWLP